MTVERSCCVPQWRCYAKYVNSQQILLTFLPASFSGAPQKHSFLAPLPMKRKFKPQRALQIFRCVGVDAVGTGGGASKPSQHAGGHSHRQQQVSERLSVRLHRWAGEVRVGHQSGQQTATQLQQRALSPKVPCAFTSDPDGGAGQLGQQSIRDRHWHLRIRFVQCCCTNHCSLKLV